MSEFMQVYTIIVGSVVIVSLLGIFLLLLSVDSNLEVIARLMAEKGDKNG